ncbi:MAG: 3'-5' exonuclease [Cyclobacteriaceae bacterium]|nr:3'-5' exonuclease [Cyclobacteriaceae bacterium]
MYLHLKNPLIFFDLETTGTNISRDKIVEMAAVKLLPDGQKISRVLLINPMIPIPAEVSLIHGITDDDVKDAPPFKNIARELARFFEGSDLAGFNIIKFDVPLLVEEFLRAGIDFDISNKKLLDAQKIFHLMEKRNLSSAYKFYCNKDLEDAHSALADTLATLEVFEEQVKRYEGNEVKDLLGKTIGRIENEMDTLHQITNQKMVDLAGRMIFNEKDEEIFNFGKHKGKRVVDVFKSEPAYYDWMLNSDFPLDTKRKLTQIKLRSFNQV